MREILTVPEVAAWLRVHPTTIYRLVKKRGMPAFRVGSDWRFVARDLALWLEQITSPPREPHPHGRNQA